MRMIKESSNVTSMYYINSCCRHHGVAKSWTQLSNFPFTFHFHALEKEMATHSSVLAWRIPRMGEPGGLPSMGSHRVRHNWIYAPAAAAAAGYKIVPYEMWLLLLCASNSYSTLLILPKYFRIKWTHFLYCHPSNPHQSYFHCIPL